MTDLTRVVKRATSARVAGSREIVVSLVPPFSLEFREKGRRVGYTLTVQEGFTVAAKLFARRRAEEKAALKKAAKKKGGKR